MADDTVVSGQWVFVKRGEILAIGSAAELMPSDTTTSVEGTDKFLLPGLADMHVHAWNESEMPLYIANGVWNVPTFY